MDTSGETLDFTPAQILSHALTISQQYEETPAYVKRYLIEFLSNSGQKDSDHPDIVSVRNLIQMIEEKGKSEKKDKPPAVQDHIAQQELELASRELAFRKKLVDYFLPKQLVDSVVELGEIPKASEETIIGIGFIDIADYSYLSKFLSPMENQSVLNGLYTAFNWVLERHGGYLNKIEGDSIMFHFGGILDPAVRGMDEAEATRHIAKELFFTCIEMQRVCGLFNQANDKFIYGEADSDTRETLQRAFDIISTLRNTLELSSAMNALFQIRIRIGANLGKVTIGSFGPEGAKQWDVIGVPVIDAKRMESTAPIGGLRISEAFFEILRDAGIADSYFTRFRKEASALHSTYQNIEQEELYRLSQVILKDKKNAKFVTYSIQVNPALPEDLARQTELLLEKGKAGADKIIEFLQYYRGNRYVINAIEEVFKQKKILIRKDQIVKTIYPKKFKMLHAKLKNQKNKGAELILNKFSLYSLLNKLGEYQDKIKSDFAFKVFQLDDSDIDYVTYGDYVEKEYDRVIAEFHIHEKSALQRVYFYNMIYPMVFRYIRTSILEYHNKIEELEEL